MLIWWLLGLLGIIVAAGVGYRAWRRWAVWPREHAPQAALHTWKLHLTGPSGRLESRRTVRLSTLPTQITRAHGKQPPSVYTLVSCRDHRAYYRRDRG